MFYPFVSPFLREKKITIRTTEKKGEKGKQKDTKKEKKEQKRIKK